MHSKDEVRIRPGAFVWVAIAPLYFFAVLGGGAVFVAAMAGLAWLTAVKQLTVILVAAAVPAILAMILLARWITKIVIKNYGRSYLRLSPTTLYIHWQEEPIKLADISNVILVSEDPQLNPFAATKYKPGKFEDFNVMLLILRDGSAVPISPAPNRFVDGGVPYVVPGLPAAANATLLIKGLNEFMPTLLARVRPYIRPGATWPEWTTPYLGPMKAQVRYLPPTQRQ